MTKSRIKNHKYSLLVNNDPMPSATSLKINFQILDFELICNLRKFPFYILSENKSLFFFSNRHYSCKAREKWWRVKVGNGRETEGRKLVIKYAPGFEPQWFSPMITSFIIQQHTFSTLDTWAKQKLLSTKSMCSLKYLFAYRWPD